MRGVPLRLEIGPKDVQNGTVMAARRDIPGKAGKTLIQQDQIAAEVSELLKTIQASLLQRATDFRDSNIHEPKDYADLQNIVQNGWAYAWWCENAACEAKVKEDTKATTRCIPLDQEGGSGRCIVCGQPASRKVHFARAY